MIKNDFRHVRIWNAKHLEVELKPFLVGQTMKALGNKPPGIVPAKGFYRKIFIPFPVLNILSYIQF